MLRRGRSWRLEGRRAREVGGGASGDVDGTASLCTLGDSLAARWACGSPLSRRLAVLPHQLCRLKAEGARQLEDVLVGQVPLAALDLAHVRPVQAGGVRQGLLGQAGCVAQLA